MNNNKVGGDDTLPGNKTNNFNDGTGELWERKAELLTLGHGAQPAPFLKGQVILFPFHGKSELFTG